MLSVEEDMLAMVVDVDVDVVMLTLSEDVVGMLSCW